MCAKRCDRNHQKAGVPSHITGISIAPIGQFRSPTYAHKITEKYDGDRCLLTTKARYYETSKASRPRETSSSTSLIIAKTMNTLQIALTQLDPILLGEGSRGSCVVRLQKVLRLAGSYSGFVDGIFGPQTRIAIEVLQDYFEMPITGIFDSSLWYALSFDFTTPETFSEDLKRGAKYDPSQERQTKRNSTSFSLLSA